MKNNITHSQLVDQCLLTGASVRKILDFGQHAFADTFVSADQLNLSEPVFPLHVYMNADSGSIQLGYASSAEDRYNLYSYSYTSSNSKTARDHWDEYAATVKQRCVAGFTVEIGSNDGYLIGQFGDNAVGVDSSADMCQVALDRGINTVNALFDEDVAVTLLDDNGPAQVIMANNVFNHANDPVAFARSVGHLLAKDGLFVFEVPYWASMIESERFVDMVYHEHPSYFTVKSTWNLLKAAGLEIVDFDVVNYHGGSLRVFARLDTGATMPAQVAKAIDHETQMGLFSVGFYKQLQTQFVQSRDAWLANFYQLRKAEPDAVFIGVGAAAKANTWLAWHGLNATHLHCVTDSSEFKQGKFTPLSRIPILADEEFARHAKPYALILSWNIGEGLRKAILNINPQTRFISQ
jgi:SAM-dependent methyltransferase